MAIPSVAPGDDTGRGAGWFVEGRRGAGSREPGAEGAGAKGGRGGSCSCRTPSPESPEPRESPEPQAHPLYCAPCFALDPPCPLPPPSNS
ncbi:hypothetical protein GLA29479_182 [Lysobacter antibioticus]|nr:hypothetical protein GLA29479_182 [Lysobacter antibioticus]